ncbi:universal stress protein UspE [Ferrimonas balearica]|uniref:universal stress protein UspE n=1 Tax=Ferrimonas balearica TaxID=44012 RepID=UPI001F27E9DD|nr:universal stress protein UspE [Ferrimonas balearica]MBY6095106.1 universal stress protein UspE [Ferrimonas balearica]
MGTYKRILVAIDPTHEAQPALVRAAHLAKCCGGQLTLLACIFDFSYEMTSMLSVDEREAMRNSIVTQRQSWLEQVSAPYREQGISVDNKVVWHNRPFEAIIEQAITGQHEVIVKSTHHHDKLKSVIFTPTDWHLLRKAPVPVLLVKEGEWPAQGKVLVAVNVAAEDDAHQTLNDEIIGHAKKLSRAINGEIHLVNGYPGTPVNIAIELPDFDAHAYNESLKAHHQQRITELARSHQLDEAHCHVIEGLPEDVIPELAEELEAELVVLGTVGRTGFSAALIGNTAEHVIDSLECDLLAIKPEGFESPVKPE